MASRFALDANCLVALVCPWHERHDETTRAVQERLRAGDALVLPAHALVEAYAVLTRLPPPHRVEPASALAALRGSFGAARLAVLPASEHWRVLDRAAAEGVAGGRAYDALIAACARRGGAKALLTWNGRHLAGFATPDMAVVAPG